MLGPGKLKVAHSVDEYIDIDQMEEAAEIYAETALRYCGRKINTGGRDEGEVG